MSENSRSFSPLYAVHTEEANMKILNWNLSPRAEKEKNMAKSAHNILLPLIPEKEFKHGSDEKSFYCVWIWSSTPNMLLCLLVSIDATQRRCGRTSTTVYRLFVFEDAGIIYVRAIVFRLCIQYGTRANCSRKVREIESSSWERWLGWRGRRMMICKRPVPPDDHLQEARSSGCSFTRGLSLQIIICKWPDPPDDHLQEAVSSGWSFARGWILRMIIWRGWILRMIICKRADPQDDHL